MRVLLDLNVLLDALLQRRPWHREADAILRAAARAEVACATTTLSLATLILRGPEGGRQRDGPCDRAALPWILRHLADRQTGTSRRRRDARERLRGQYRPSGGRGRFAGRHRHAQRA